MGLGTLLVRADASPEIGAGHVMRCLALAQAWQDAGGDVCFACHRPSESLVRRLSSEGFHLQTIHTSDLGSGDAVEIRKIGQDLRPSWLAIDGYGFSDRYLDEVSVLGLPILLIDDHGTRGAYDAATIIVNPNIYADRAMYPHFAGCLLAGPAYSLLRREFLDWRVQKSMAKRFDLVVTFGGSDPANLTSLVLEGLEHLKRELKVAIIVGAANRHLSRIELLAANSTHSPELFIDANNIAEIIASSRNAISAPGGTAAEIASLGIPMLLVTFAKNHERTGEEFAANGCACSLGWYTGLSSDALGCRISEFLDNESGRRAWASTAACRFDGQGAGRVVRHMINLEIKPAA